VSRIMSRIMSRIIYLV